ncbi:MAG: DUF4405 domain-containing protein [Desulfobacterales bacterium]
MSLNRTEKLWIVNVVTFILLSIMILTGVVLWLLHGGGPVRRGGGWFHMLRDVHTWTALFFVVSVGVHLLLHRSYIRNQMTKMMDKGGTTVESRRR